MGVPQRPRSSLVASRHSQPVYTKKLIYLYKVCFACFYEISAMLSFGCFGVPRFSSLSGALLYDSV